LRLLILGWLPIKLLLLYLAPPEIVAIRTGDWQPFHTWGVLFSDYWRHGGDWFPSSELIQEYSMKYPGAIHLFGIPYFIFGQYGYVVIPWLGFIQLLTAAMAYNLFIEAEFEQRVAAYAMLYILYCPAWLSLTNQLFRDIFLMLGLVVFMYGVIQLINKKLINGLLTTSIGFILTILLREQYVLVLAIFSLVIFVFVQRSRLSSVVIMLLVAVVGYSIVQAVFHPGRDSTIIERTLANFEISSQVGEVGTSSYATEFANLSGFLLPVAIPFRFLVGIVAPFPWTNMDVTLAKQCGESWLYAGLHILQALFHLSLAFMLLTFLQKGRDKMVLIGERGLIILCFGLFIGLAAALSYVGYYRNILPAFLFFLPVLFVVHGKWRLQSMIIFSSFLISCLHIAYYVFRSIM